MQIYFDRNGIMWIGTDKGLCRYDGANAYTISTDDGLITNLVYCIFEDDDHSIWVGGSQSGLSKLEVTGSSLQNIKTIQRSLSVRSVSKDDSGYYWIKTSRGLNAMIWRTKDLEKEWERVASLTSVYAAEVNPKGVLYYIPQKSTIVSTKDIKTKAIEGFSESDSASLLVSKSKIALISKKETRIFNEDGASYTINMPGSTTGLGNYGYYLSDGTRDIFYRTKAGDVVFDRGKFTCRLSTTASGNSQDFFFVIAADAYHRLYLSHFGKGILQWRSPYMVKYDFYDKIGRIQRTGQGIIFNIGNHVYTHQYSNQSNVKIHSHDRLQLIASDEFGHPLLGINDSLQFYSKKKYADNQHRVYDISDAIYFDHAYYVSSYSVGLHRIVNDQLDTTWTTSLTGPGLERLKVYDSSIYVTTLSKGLFVVNPQSRIVQNFNRQNGIISNAVYDVYKESDTLWIGSNKGFTKIVHTNAVPFDASAGFIGNRVTCLFRDQQKRFWVLSDNMLHLFTNNKLVAIRSYPILTNETSYINSAYYDDRVDKLWVGTNEHLLAVDMRSIQPEHESYPLTIGNILADGKLVTAGEKTLELSSNIDKLEINFINPHISLYSKPAIYYRLEGYNRDWELLNPQQVITFQQLPAGNYTLETKTIGPDFGYHINRHQLAIHVLQPWYFQHWFIIASILLLMVAGFFTSRFFSKKKYHAQIKKLQAEQALELERMRISRELHDNVGSMLTVVINRLSDAPVLSEKEQVSITHIARKTLSQLRDAIWTLDKSHLSMEQWMNRARQYLQQLSSNGTDVSYDFVFPANDVLTPMKALHSFRVMQEACTNALKHAHASCIYVSGTVNPNGQYQLLIKDNGKGFTVNGTDKGYGLRNIEKRANELGGQLVIDTAPNKGTIITLIW